MEQWSRQLSVMPTGKLMCSDGAARNVSKTHVVKKFLNKRDQHDDINVKGDLLRTVFMFTLTVVIVVINFVFMPDTTVTMANFMQSYAAILQSHDVQMQYQTIMRALFIGLSALVSPHLFLVEWLNFHAI